MRVEIVIKDASSFAHPNVKFYVKMDAREYGHMSPCYDESCVKRAVDRCKNWAIKEGDKPFVTDKRISGRELQQMELCL